MKAKFKKFFGDVKALLPGALFLLSVVLVVLALYAVAPNGFIPDPGKPQVWHARHSQALLQASDGGLGHLLIVGVAGVLYAFFHFFWAVLAVPVIGHTIIGYLVVKGAWKAGERVMQRRKQQAKAQPQQQPHEPPALAPGVQPAAAPAATPPLAEAPPMRVRIRRPRAAWSPPP